MRTVQRAADGGSQRDGLAEWTSEGERNAAAEIVGDRLRDAASRRDGGEASLPRFSICLYAQSGQMILPIRVAPQEYCSCPCKNCCGDEGIFYPFPRKKRGKKEEAAR